ncbi:MAG: SCO family protein [Nannocystaceae bacterium]
MSDVRAEIPEGPAARPAGAPPPVEERNFFLRVFMRHPFVVAFFVGITLITVMRPLTRHVPEAPAVILEVPDFHLVDQDGRPFDLGTMRGKVWVAGFIFTRCPSTCPKITQAMIGLQEKFETFGHDAHLVAFSVDPENDTPEVLARYAATVGADPERFRFVTGPREAMESLVIGGFKLAMDKPAPVPGQPTMIDIAHSTKLAIIDPNGGIRGFYSTDELGLDEIYHRTQHVLRDVREGKI